MRDLILTDAVNGFFAGKRYLIHDRDPLYTKDFLAILAGSGIESVKLPPRSPNLNAYAERFVRTIKEGCLEQMILFGEDSLRKAFREFVAHYNLGRNHQGTRQPVDHTVGNSGRDKRHRKETRATRWNAELLLPDGRMISVFGPYEVLIS
jgi:hypothetical protein